MIFLSRRFISLSYKHAQCNNFHTLATMATTITSTRLPFPPLSTSSSFPLSSSSSSFLPLTSTYLICSASPSNVALSSSWHPCRSFSSYVPTMAEIKHLREITGAPIVDVKKALSNAQGDLDQALENLRMHGLKVAQKRAGKSAKEGLVACYVGQLQDQGDNTDSSSPQMVALVEIGCETDFVARTQKFKDLVMTVAQTITALDPAKIQLISQPASPSPSPSSGASSSSSSSSSPVSQIDVVPLSHVESIHTTLSETVAALSENIQIRQAYLMRTDTRTGIDPEADAADRPAAFISTYVHAQVTPDMGKIAVALLLQPLTPHASDAERQAHTQVAKQVAMHVAAAAPLYLAIEDVPQHFVEAQMLNFIQEARDQGKPEKMVQNIAKGKLAKLYEEVVLLEQKYVVAENNVKVKKVLSDQGLLLLKFLRLQIGN